jgi:hypothetical protein
VLFLYIQGCVPYCRVIPTRIVVSHTVVLDLHIKSYYPCTYRVLTYSST